MDGQDDDESHPAVQDDADAGGRTGVDVRVVVVGASGNIGTAVLRQLAAERRGGADDDVIGVARRVPPTVAPYDLVTAWHPVDIAATDAASRLTPVFAGADVVVHLAWGFQPTRRPAQLAAVGPGGTARVVEAVRAAGVPRLVHLSSVGAYAPRRDTRPVDETWPTTGVPSSLYSRHKAQAERLLDRVESASDAPAIVRLRPGFVVQRAAGAALGRYGLPPWLPRPLLSRVPLVPLPDLLLPVVASEDVARAVVAAARTDVTGPFNLAAPPPVDTAALAAALGGRPVPVPAGLARAAVDASWRLRLQPIDAGWFDLALVVPQLDTTRARDLLRWVPTVDARAALRDTIVGIAHGDGLAGRVLGPRRGPVDTLVTAVRAGSASRRRLT